MSDTGNKIKGALERLGEYYPPLRTLAILGSHPRMSAANVFFSFAAIDAARRLRRLGILRGAMDAVLANRHQAVAHHPNFVANRADRRIQILSVSLTYHCSRGCSFCYARGLKEKFREHMTPENFSLLCDWALAQGWRCVRLIGGEPTEHPRFAELLEIAGRKGLTVYVTTNGLFGPELNAPLAARQVRSICYSYPQEEASPAQLEAFRRNFAHSADHGRIVALACVITRTDDGWRRAIDFARRYRARTMIRFSLELPGHARTFGTAGAAARLRELGDKAYGIARAAVEAGVVFAFYRPLIPCIFTPEQLAYLKSVSPFLFYTRCPLCLDGDYDAHQKFLVNPDLSCYPCTALAAEGVKIAPGVTREQLDARFAPLVKDIGRRPLLDACAGCEFHANYLAKLESPQDLADRTVCQGGCFQYRV